MSYIRTSKDTPLKIGETPILPMENNNDLNKYFDKLINPIFNKVLKEKNPNSMTTVTPTRKKLWRPNNYRRQIQVKKKDNSIIKNILSTIESTGKRQINFNEHTNIISIKNYKPNITLQYGRDKLTCIFSQNIIYGHKETFLIEANNIDDIEERIDQKAKEITSRMDKALNTFIDKFNLRLEQEREPVWSRYEDWLKGIDFIDNIPRESIIHDTYFKKVYPTGIEYKQTKEKEGPSIHLKNTIRNQAIRDVAPAIEQELNTLREGIDKLGPVLEKIHEVTLLEIKNKKLHQKVLNSMDKTMKDIRDDLKQKRLNEYI